MSNPLHALVPLAAVAVLVAGCGGGSTSSGSSSGSAAGSASAASSTSPGSAYGAAAKPAPAAKGDAVLSTRKLALGTVLVGPDGRTLYVFDADHGMSSACSASCAADWPPLTTSGAPKATGAAKASMLATINRADGTRQVTYGGHPLYSYAGDQQPGQASGQGSVAFGAPWYVAAPSGGQITGS
jgi:predicted lipoprotein with Yx(FWY)xxD motif